MSLPDHLTISSMEAEGLVAAHARMSVGPRSVPASAAPEITRTGGIEAWSPPRAPATRVGLKRALIVGINYVNTRYALRGCINDALDIRKQVVSFFPTCNEIRLITDDTPLRPTKEEIMRGLLWLTQELQPGEHVLFHYSGHGGTVRDVSGDEQGRLDSCLYPINNSRLEVILDDEVRSSLVERVPQGSKCLIVLDSCHSGTAADLRYIWRAPSASVLTYTEARSYPKTAGTVLALTSCLDSQSAADTKDERGRPCGALTMALLRAWNTYGPALKFKHLLWDVQNFLKQRRYAQVPQLSTGAPYDINASFDLSAA